MHNGPATTALVYDGESPMTGQLTLVSPFCARDPVDPSPHRGQRRAMESNRPT